MNYLRSYCLYGVALIAGMAIATRWTDWDHSHQTDSGNRVTNSRSQPDHDWAEPGVHSAVASLVTCAAIAQFEEIDDRRGVDDWENDPNFPHDVFTFVRVKYADGNPRWRNNRGRWRTDYPDSDLNFSFRLQQLTSMKVNPDPIILELTDKRIYDYPFLYMIEPGDLTLSDEEAKNLRRYLDNGGFLMVDDFWGEYEYDNFAFEMKKVFPKRDPIKLKLEHPVFHCVYDLKVIPQVPSLGAWQQSGLAHERIDGTEPDYRAIFDDKGRMSVIICHNTDLGDGWEREGQDKEYFKKFSEPLAYPMGINIVVYAMTH